MNDYLLDEPRKASSSVCLFLPGISGGALTEEYSQLASLFIDANIALLRLEPWHSKATLTSITLNKVRDQIDEAVSFLKGKQYSHIFAIGKSFGAAMILYNNPSAFEKLVLWAPAVQITDTSSLQTFRDIPFEKIDSIFDVHPSKDDLMGVPTTLIIRGDQDNVVSEESMNQLVATLPDASLVNIQKMGHSPSSAEDWGQLFNISIEFLSR